MDEKYIVTYTCAFPSPHGDKFQLLHFNPASISASGFRPLTGINFNQIVKARGWRLISFRPLTGINFNGNDISADFFADEFPSPHGDKFQPNHQDGKKV